jgi:5-(carboxyamino)imidazole ribonucleotide mutase
MILILAGSKSDEGVVNNAEGVLREAGEDYKVEYSSAHREPDRLDQIIKNSDADAFICIVGLSAALPGVTASKTDKPVIGVPVACVGIDNGQNAAHLALRILKS